MYTAISLHKILEEEKTAIDCNHDKKEESLPQFKNNFLGHCTGNHEHGQTSSRKMNVSITYHMIIDIVAFTIQEDSRIAKSSAWIFS